MPSHQNNSAFWVKRFLAIGLGAACIALLLISLDPASLQGYVLRRVAPIPWKIFDAEDVLAGVTVPASTHVVFHLPENFETITEKVLFGQKSESVLYWGYCLPENYNPETVARRRGIPGQIFLSRKERKRRRDAERLATPVVSRYRLPTKEDIENAGKRISSQIRHQLDVFTPGLLCYVMSEAPLPLGLDEDLDDLNTDLEREIGSDPEIPDSDADGIWDGIEYIHGTSPFLRDTDSDNIIDGVEDANWNGKIDRGETDPRSPDSDRDGLCDGLCRMRLSNDQEVYLGEDINLNGQLDDGETSPLSKDTDKNGIADEVEVIDCILSGSNCPDE